MYCTLGVAVTVAVSIILVGGLRFACEEVDVVVTLGGSCEEHAVWMECRRRDGGAAVCVYPAGVWLNGGELPPFEVEDLDSVFRCSAMKD